MTTLGRRGFLGALGALAAAPLVPAAAPVDPMVEMLEIQRQMLEAMAGLARSFGAELPASVQRYVGALERTP